MRSTLRTSGRIRSTHVHVSKKHLHRYAKEFENRFNSQQNPSAIFPALVSSFSSNRLDDAVKVMMTGSRVIAFAFLDEVPKFVLFFGFFEVHTFTTIG